MNHSSSNNYGFLSGGGEMGEFIRAYDWENTSLGKPATWPQGLKTAIRLLLSSGHPMFIFWGTELIQFYNDPYSRSLGPESHPSALGQRGEDFWVDIWHIIDPQIKQVMSGGGATWHENDLMTITRYGKREDIYWTYSYNPIDEPSSANGIGGVLVVCTETTAQVLSEQRNKQAEARWLELFQQAPGFMCILNGPHHTYEFANPSYIELVGGRNIIGKTVYEALPEVRDQGFQDLLDHVYRSGEAYIGTSTPLALAQAGDDALRQRFLDFVYQPIRNAKGEVTGIFVDGYDVTERVRSNQRLLEEDRHKDEFLAMLAHELRNPLAPIRNAGEMLTQTSAAGSNTKAIGELITRQVKQLNHLVDDLLDVSRITQGRIELQRKPLELDGLIKLAIESSQTLFSDKHQHVNYQGHPGIFINGDVTRITQCLTNLLNNAAKYTLAEGLINVGLRKEDGMAVIEVSDNGMGISAEVLPKIFDLFVQADRALDRSQGGLGIGLSIVQRLTQMHGGHVVALSKGLNQGATFQLFLPIVDAPVEPTTSVTELNSSPVKILIVDDNVDAADTLAMLLEFKGHETGTAYNGQQALEQVRTYQPNIVLLDIGLPDVDGYEVARQIRSDQNTSVLIALTGYGKAEDVKRALDAGFNAHLTKPVALENIERLIYEYHPAATEAT